MPLTWMSGEAEADATDRLQVARVRGVIFELLAEIAHVHVHHMVVVVLVAPHALKELDSTEDSPRVSSKCRE
jgi:hypothetical protein